MVTEVASSLPLQTNVSVLVVRTSAMRMLLTETSLDFAANVSLVSLSHIHAQRCAHADTHTRERAHRRPIRQCLAHSAFSLPADWRTEVAREGRGRGELRGKTTGHMSRDLFTNPRQSRARARGGREERAVGSLWAPLRTERGRGEACHDKASWRWERLKTTHTDTLVAFVSDFFFPQLKEQMVRGRVGSPPSPRTHTHTNCTDWNRNTNTNQQNTKPS